MELLSVNKLTASFGDSLVLHSLNFSLSEGAVLGVVGESGCGKTTLLRSIMALRAQNAKFSGSVHFMDCDMLKLTDKELQNIRGNEIAMIPQNASLAMDPVKTVSALFYETVKVHNRHIKRRQTDAQAAELMRRLHLEEPERILRSYPFELSGGMGQRVMIAASMMNQPRLLLADEPTSALDGAAQKMVLQELDRLKREFQVSMILVSHNLGVVASLADEIAVMKDGDIVEIGAKDDILQHPEQDYTKQLIAAVPALK